MGEESTRNLDIVARSLRQTADRAEQIEQAITRLAAGGNEHAAGTDQTRVAIESIVRDRKASCRERV